MLIGLLVLLLPLITGQFISQVLVLVGLYLLLALGLNIVVGYAGLLDLGYVAFFAVGAYLMAILTSPDGPLGAPLVQIAGEAGAFWLALPFVMIGAAATGLLIGAPVLRLRGDYLAIVTLGFGEIARILFLSDALEPWLGGVQGIIGIPSPLPNRVELALGPLDLGVARPDGHLLRHPALLPVRRLRRLSPGQDRGWVAPGTRCARTRRWPRSPASAPSTTSCWRSPWAPAWAASSGALFAVQLRLRLPGQLQHPGLDHGAGHHHPGRHGQHPGRDRRCLVLIGLPELLREFAEYRLLVYGAVLVGMMLLRPEGLIPNVGRRRELHEAEDEDEQYDTEVGEDVARPVIA